MISLAKNETETKEIASQFAHTLKVGDIVLLNGDLGAGKTTFTRYVFEELGVTTIVNSPTFAIMKVYDSPLCELYHFDTYRLSIDEAIEAGFDEIFAQHEDKIIFIEWSDNVRGILPKCNYIINLKYVDKNSREIEVKVNE